MIQRNTIQLALVLNAVNKLACHPTADEVFDEIIKDYPTIGRGTVYRNLNRLAELGEIRKVLVPTGADRYDHQCHNHYHVVCEKCGRIFDVKMDYIQGLENKISDTEGFKLTGHDIIFKGICPECQKSGK